jgi:hypothetical protein
MTPEQRLAKQKRDRAYRERKRDRAEAEAAAALAAVEARRARKQQRDREFRARQHAKRKAANPIPTIAGHRTDKKLAAGQLLPGSLKDPARWQSMTKAEYDAMQTKRPLTGSGFIGQFTHSFKSAS